MRIVLAHLSDLHLRDPAVHTNPLLDRADRLGRAIASTPAVCEGEVVALGLVLTGDIAFSGRATEYDAAESFLARVRQEVTDRHPELRIFIASVPGNHDCNFAPTNSVRDHLVETISASKIDAGIIEVAASVQREYRHFEARVAPPTEVVVGGLAVVHDIDLGAGHLRLQALNTALLSRKKEAQGDLLFPTSLLPAAEGDRSPLLSVSLFHHPYNWLQADNARTFMKHIESVSDLVLTGHEHDQDAYSKARHELEAVEYLEGHALQEHGDSAESGFQLISIDLDTQRFDVIRFRYQASPGAYLEQGRPQSRQFVGNRRRLHQTFRTRQSFREALADPGAGYTHPRKATLCLRDLYVCPDFREVRLDREVDEATLLRSRRPESIVIDEKLVVFQGEEKSGKTALAHILFEEVRRQGFVPVLLNGSDFKSSRSDHVGGVIRSAFHDAYEGPVYDLFRQLDVETKAVIVDDFQATRLNAEGREFIARELRRYFEVVVLITSTELALETLVGSQHDQYIASTFTHFELMEFGHVKRHELVQRWHSIGSRYGLENRDVERRIRWAERLLGKALGNNYVPSYPAFLLIMLQQLEVRSKGDVIDDAGSYGFLYEYLITRVLTRGQASAVSLETKYSYLAELAWRLHSEDVADLGADEYEAWHQDYVDIYEIRLSSDIRDELVASGILSARRRGVGFRYRYLYYYFLARYLADHLTEESIRASVRRLSRQLYHEESANVMVFLCHLSKDPFILQTVLGASRTLFEELEACDLLVHTRFLDELAGRLPEWRLDNRSPERRREEARQRADEIEGALGNSGHEDESPPPPDEADEGVETVLQLNAAFKTIHILGQILKDFSGSIKGDTKLELAAECYGLGLRTLRAILGTMEENLDGLAAVIEEGFESQQPESRLTPVEMEQLVRSILFNTGERLSFIVIKHVGEAVGAESLSKTVSRVLEQHRGFSHRMIDCAMRMEHFRSFPERELFKLYHECDGHPLVRHLIQHTVWNHFYLFDEPMRLRQRVCERIGIKTSAPALIASPRMQKRTQ
ncbi:MAG: hypothetical protein ACQEXJ_15530 [Myxococcota bacterium]